MRKLEIWCKIYFGHSLVIVFLGRKLLGPPQFPIEHPLTQTGLLAYPKAVLHRLPRFPYGIFRRAGEKRTWLDPRRDFSPAVANSSLMTYACRLTIARSSYHASAHTCAVISYPAENPALASR
jgi:hypothetical protein